MMIPTRRRSGGYGLLIPCLLLSGGWPVSAPGQADRQADRLAQPPEVALRQFRVAPGLQVGLFAAEPVVRNPVSFCFDSRGRIYLVETFRRRSSVFDIRDHADWLEADFAFRAVEDREKFFKDTLRAQNEQVAQRFLRSGQGNLGDFNRDGRVDWRDLKVETERVIRIEDLDGDGMADRAHVFAEGLDSIVSGVAAGVLAHQQHVYVACIPDLWKLEDAQDDGQAERREAMVTGFGVHIGFGGHDMHGLVLGPDGKIYWSIGDRGTSTNLLPRLAPTFAGLTAEKLADSGSVFRCNIDGSDLELVATGLRNPQELAFDQFGNLFTGDNNGDGGDPARWVHVVEGSDSGWTMGWQWLPKLGGWNAEQLWACAPSNHAAYVLPPVAHIGHGPAGLEYYPGTGLPERYQNHFFMCNFPGNVLTWTNRHKGASFEAGPVEVFFGDLGPTDLAFAPGGGLFVSDWLKTFEKTDRGRIYRIEDPELERGELALQTKLLLATRFEERSANELIAWLRHPDRRVRLAAQFALAKPNHFGALTAVARSQSPTLARLHALWALGRIGQIEPIDRRADDFARLSTLLSDPDPEIRSHAARLLGRAGVAAAQEPLLALFRDPTPQVRFHALMAYRDLIVAARRQGHRFTPQWLQSFTAAHSGRMLVSDRPHTAPILSPHEALEAILIQNDADQDRFLRHAAVLLLVEIDRVLETTIARMLSHWISHPSAEVRMAMLLTFRRLGEPAVGTFLGDSDPRMILEAARSIYDHPMPDALLTLASWIGVERGVPTSQSLSADDPSASTLEPTPGSVANAPARWEEFAIRRALYANFRLGGEEQADRLARFASASARPEGLRIEALDLLRQWAKPPARDGIVGLWRPIAERPAQPAASALAKVLPGLLLSAPEPLKVVASKAAAQLGVELPDPIHLLKDPALSVPLRVEALRALVAANDPRTSESIQYGLTLSDESLRVAALELAAEKVPAQFLQVAGPRLEQGSTRERQAIFAALPALDDPAALSLLAQWMDRLLQGQAPRALHLDILEAAERRGDPELLPKLDAYRSALDAADPLAAYRPALAGGDAEAGRLIAYERQDAGCFRCHKIHGEGGEVGPELAGVGRAKGLEYLLESIVLPSKQVAREYESVLVVLKDGRSVAGQVLRENEEQVVIQSPEDGPTEILKADIESRQTGMSAMPAELATLLSKRELRDLIAFLAQLDVAQP